MTRLAGDHTLLVTVEENVVMGGAGSAVGECLAAHNLSPSIIHIGLPDHFVEQGGRGELLAECGLTAEGILQRITSHTRQLSPQKTAAQINSY